MTSLDLSIGFADVVYHGLVFNNHCNINFFKGVEMKHELKTWPQYFCRVADGTKTFEVRKNDRGFQQGDTVILKEWSPETERIEHNNDPIGPETYTQEIIGYTRSEPLEFKIGYVFPIDAERVVFALLPLCEDSE